MKWLSTIGINNENMRKLKLIGKFIFLFVITLLASIGFESEKITTVQLWYNLIETIIFFAVILGIVKFDRFLMKKEFRTATFF